MTRAAKIYSYPIAAGASLILPVDGGYYKILSATGPLGVARNGANGLDGLIPGQGERENFTWLTLQDQSGATNNVRVLVADNSFVDDTIYGQVQVVDGGRLISQQNLAFVGNGNQGPTAGLFPQVQLWNPPGNTRWAAISRIIVGSFSASIQTIQIRPHNAALAVAGNIPQPKLIAAGASTSTMEMKLEQNAALLGGSVIGLASVISVFPFEFKEPLILRPGQGVIVSNATVNTTVIANFDFIEFTP